MEAMTVLGSALLAPSPPYLYLVQAEMMEWERWACLFARPERDKPALLARFLIRGWQCRTAARLFDEFAASLQFPSYFGRNRDAFEDCLTDLDWWHGQLGYVLYILKADEILAEEPEQLSTCLDVLHCAGEYWRQQSPPVPFHAVFQVEPKLSKAPLIKVLEHGALSWQHLRGERAV
jgi:hypothetical protein